MCHATVWAIVPCVTQLFGPQWFKINISKNLALKKEPVCFPARRNGPRAVTCGSRCVEDDAFLFERSCPPRPWQTGPQEHNKVIPDDWDSKSALASPPHQESKEEIKEKRKRQASKRQARRRAKMKYSAEALNTPQRKQRTVTPAPEPEPETPVLAYARQSHQPCDPATHALLQMLVDAAEKKTAANLQAQKDGNEAIKQRHQETLEAIERNTAGTKERNNEIWAVPESHISQQLALMSASVPTGTPIAAAAAAAPSAYETPDVRKTLEMDTTAASSRKRPPLNPASKGSSKCKKTKGLPKIYEDSPASYGSITPMAKKKTLGITERLLLIALPDGSTVDIPGMENFLGSGFTVNNSHASFLQANGCVFAVDLMACVPESAKGNSAPSSSVLRRVASTASLGMISPTPSKKSAISKLDFGKDVFIKQMSSYGDKTMAVSAKGVLYSYDKTLRPVRVEPKCANGRAANLSGKIVEVHPGGTFYSVKLEDASVHILYYDGEEKDENMPEGHVRLPRGRVVEHLSPGFAHCVMVASNSNTRNADSKAFSLYTIGDNSHGQLGLNDKNGNRNRQKWTEVKSGLLDDNIVFASANDYYSLALTQSGTISYFGEYPGKEAVKKPHALNLTVDGAVKFSSIDAAKDYAIGIVTPEGCDEVAWMFLGNGEVKQVCMPENDSRTIVKVNKICSGVFSVLEVEAVLGGGESTAGGGGADFA